MHQENVDAGRSFGAAAELYDRLRYTPSDQVLAWLLSEQERGQVLDLASGTGQIARQLTDDFIGRGGAVFALEPDPRMRRVLRARVPRATVIDGTAESIPLATASIDTVLAVSVGREDLAESFETHSYYRTAGPERQAAVVAQVSTALAAHFPGASTIELATRTVCWRARRTRRGGGS